MFNKELGEVISLAQFVYTLLHIQSSLCVNYILNLTVNSIDSIFQSNLNAYYLNLMRLFIFKKNLFKVVDIILDGCNCSQIDVQRHKCLLAITSFWPHLSSYIINECVSYFK